MNDLGNYAEERARAQDELRMRAEMQRGMGAGQGLDAVGGQAGRYVTGNVVKPASSPTIPDLLDTAATALKRLHLVADSVEMFGDKLFGGQPAPSGLAQSLAGGDGSMVQLHGLLSGIHSTISRVETAMSRLHAAHG